MGLQTGDVFSFSRAPAFAIHEAYKNCLFSSNLQQHTFSYCIAAFTFAFAFFAEWMANFATFHLVSFDFSCAIHDITAKFGDALI